MSNDFNQVIVDGHRIGVFGLNGIFAEIEKLKLADINEIQEELIKRARKKNYIPLVAKESYKIAFFREYQKYLGFEVQEKQELLEILILGPGCQRCDELLKRVKNASAQITLEADIHQVKDLNKIGRFGPAPTPVLVINNKIISTGNVPSEKELINILSGYLV